MSELTVESRDVGGVVLLYPKGFINAHTVRLFEGALQKAISLKQFKIVVNCSGLSYIFAWEKEARFGDEVFQGPEGSKLYVDKKSLLFLNGTVLDYDTNLVSKGFVFNNPNAKTTCGCGSSFGA